MSLQLEVVTPQKKIIGEDAVDWVTLPGSEGELGILPEHIPLMTTLKSGVLVYQQGAKTQAMAIHWGYAQVATNQVTVLAELAETAEEVDLARAQIAEKKAVEVLGGSFGDDEEERRRLDKYESKLKRALVRQSVASFK